MTGTLHQSLLMVTDLDEVHRRAEEAGVDVRMEPRDVSWGRRMAILADPDGYVVEVSAPL